MICGALTGGVFKSTLGVLPVRKKKIIILREYKYELVLCWKYIRRS